MDARASDKKAVGGDVEVGVDVSNLGMSHEAVGVAYLCAEDLR